MSPFFEKVFRVVIDATDPVRLLERSMEDAAEDLEAKKRFFMLSAGKASRGMAKAVLDRGVLFDQDASGLVVCRHEDHVPEVGDVPVISASHPLPDAHSFAAGRRALDIAKTLGPDDLMLVLLSGGASALLECPLPGWTEKQILETNKTLISSGLPIGQINAVRRRMSAIKGGRLAAAAYPARTIAFLLSDVPGDVISDIGSGPTLPPPSDECFHPDSLSLPEDIVRKLKNPTFQPISHDTGLFQNSASHLIGGPDIALEIAHLYVENAGFETCNLGLLDKDAAELGSDHAQRLLGMADGYLRPRAIISGGEATVSLTSNAGRGGPAKHYLLALVDELSRNGEPSMRERVWAFAADTDGFEGGGDDAGAWFGPDTPLDAEIVSDALEHYDSLSVFSRAGTVFRPGPTGTNVNDLRILLLDPPTRVLGLLRDKSERV